MSEPKIRIAGVPEHFNLPWHLGIEDGHFERVDALAEFQVFSGGTGAMMGAVADDQVDLAIVLSEGCIQSLTSGTPAKIVKTFVASPLIWGIHTPATSDVQSLEQMQGKRYAISRFGRLTPWPAFVVCASDKAIAERGDAIARLLNQVNKLCRQLAGSPEDTIEQISQRYKLPVDQTTAWFKTLQWSVDWQMDDEKFVSAIEYLQSLGLIEGKHAQRNPAAVWEDVYLSLS